MNYQQLERRIKELETRKERAQGSIEQLIQGLADFGCKTVEQAREKLRELTTARNETQAEFDSRMELFLKKYRSRLNEDD